MPLIQIKSHVNCDIHLTENIFKMPDFVWNFVQSKKYKKVIDNRKIRAYNATHTKQTKPIKIVWNSEKGCRRMSEETKKKILDSTNIKKLESILQNVKYGSVTIFMQDGKIVQIEKTEKYRMTWKGQVRRLNI